MLPPYPTFPAVFFFLENAVEWTGKVEIRDGEIPKRSMYGCILTKHQALNEELFTALCLNRGDPTICVRCEEGGGTRGGGGERERKQRKEKTKMKVEGG